MEKNMLFGILVVVCIGCLIGFNFIYLPKVEELRLLEKRQKEEEDKKVLHDEMIRLSNRLNSYERQSIPTGKEEIELLNSVRDIAGDAQVGVISLVPQSTYAKRKRFFEKYSLTISFSGTYHHLGDFISMVENNDKFLKIDRLEFNTVQQQEAALPLQCYVTLSIYSLL